MTGLSKQVIRKLEERYNLVNPKRLENGYRIYSDIHSFVKVKVLSIQGHSIKHAVELSKERAFISAAVSNPVFQHTPVSNDFVFQLLEKGTHCDELKLQLTLQQAYHPLGISIFLTIVVAPFFK